jgi:hypothetical protein
MHVYPRDHPQRMNPIVRDDRHRRNLQPAIPAQMSESGGDQRMGRHHQIRLLFVHDLEQPARKERAYEEPHGRRARSSRGYGEDDTQRFW